MMVKCVFGSSAEVVVVSWLFEVIDSDFGIIGFLYGLEVVW